MNFVLIVATIGSLAGLLAGLGGTYLAIVSADGPRERAFMVRGALICWGAVVLVLAARLFLPIEWPVVSILGAIALRPAITWWSERQVEIRHAERARRVQATGGTHPSGLL